MLTHAGPIWSAVACHRFGFGGETVLPSALWPTAYSP